MSDAYECGNEPSTNAGNLLISLETSNIEGRF
jgi:hypothetical protein